MSLILASDSLFHKRAMELIGLPYETCFACIDEKANDNPADVTRNIAEAKARKVAGEYPSAVVGSDDEVAAKGKRIFEKPRNKLKKRQRETVFSS